MKEVAVILFVYKLRNHHTSEWYLETNKQQIVLCSPSQLGITEKTQNTFSERYTGLYKSRLCRARCHHAVPQ